MDIYVAMVNDRHDDPEPFLFTTAQAAVDFARKYATDSVKRPEDFEETHVGLPSDWLYSATFSVEGDSVWVLKKATDA